MDEFATKAIRRGSAFLVVCSVIQFMFFDATIGRKNYTICKIYVSDIFLTD